MDEQASSAAAKPEYDLRDWLVLGLLGMGFVCAWVYAFVHPSEGTYAICVGSTGTFGAVFHRISVTDDKIADAK